MPRDAADHDADLGPDRCRIPDLPGDALDDLEMDAEALVAREYLARELQHDAAIGGTHSGALSPSLKRTKPVTRTG